MSERENLQDLVRLLSKTVEAQSFAGASAPATVAALLTQIDQIEPATVARLAAALARPKPVDLPTSPFDFQG